MNERPLESAWLTGEPCAIHGEPFCGACKPRGETQQVYISAGGSAFHKTLRCDKFKEGQALIAERGGTPAVPTTVSRGAAIAAGRSQCQGCW